MNQKISLSLYKNATLIKSETLPQHRSVVTCLFVCCAGHFPVRYRRSAGAGGNGEGIAQLHEEAHAQAGIAVGVSCPEAG